MTNAAVSARRLHPPVSARAVRGLTSAIAGVGVATPETVVTNDDFHRRGLDTSDEWIATRTGIRERRIAEPGTPAAALGERAARHALEAAGTDPASVDVIVVSSTSPDGPMPSMACRIQEGIGAVGAMAVDVLAACTGFLYALSMADAAIAAGRADTALVIGAEVMSRVLDWNDRSTCVLFGDGAGAVVLRRARAGAGFLSWCVGADGRGSRLVGVGTDPRGAWAAGEHDAKLFMNGPEVFRFAVDVFVRQGLAIAEAAGMSPADVDLWVPHQANQRIIEASARRLGVPMERVVLTIDRYANTSSSSIPIALDHALAGGRLRSGDRVGLLTMGAGLTWGACLLRWE
jgi:3-oxoacyl-[acyl-carrier-protein] synthase III